MTDHPRDKETSMTTQASEQAAFERDRLIERLVDGEASAGDWARLARFADEDRGFWAHIAERQPDRDALASAVEEAIAVADHIELDDAWMTARTDARRASGLRVWGGWAAAAALVLVALLQGSIVISSSRTPSQGEGSGLGTVQAGLATPADLSPAQLLSRYIAAGRDEGSVVHAEEPVVLSARPSDDADRIEVLVMRQIVERRYVDRVPRLTVDELGRYQAVPVPASSLTRTRLTY